MSVTFLLCLRNRAGKARNVGECSYGTKCSLGDALVYPLAMINSKLQYLATIMSSTCVHDNVVVDIGL